jgi:serine/threonine protein kinase
VYVNNTLKKPSESAAFSQLAGSVQHSLQHVMHPDYEITPAELHLGSVLGEGEYGTVYRARWHGAPVAVKVLKSSAAIRVEEFAAEIAMLLRIHHPNTVQFLGAVTRSEPFMIVTELMEGNSLDFALRSNLPFSLRRALEVALACARGLAYLHLPTPSEIMHRDLKPSNVMFQGYATAMSVQELAFDTGVAKLADFGLSKTLNARRPHVESPLGMLQRNGTYLVQPSKLGVQERSGEALGLLQPSQDTDEHGYLPRALALLCSSCLCAAALMSCPTCEGELPLLTPCIFNSGPFLVGMHDCPCTVA